MINYKKKNHMQVRARFNNFNEHLNFQILQILHSKLPRQHIIDCLNLFLFGYSNSFKEFDH